MKPSEVIAMRDELSAQLEELKDAGWVAVADFLIGSGWVTRETGRGNGDS